MAELAVMSVLTLPLDEEVRALSGEFSTALSESGKAVPDAAKNLSALAYYVGQLACFSAELSGKGRTEALAAVFVVIGEGWRDRAAEMEELKERAGA